MQKDGASEAIPPTPAKPPVSCVGWLDSLLGLIVMFAVFFGLRHDTRLSDPQLCGMMVAALGAALGTIEILRAPWRKTKVPGHAARDVLKRAAVKYIGFLAGLAFIGFLYWVFPEYRREFYNRYFEMVFLIAPWLPAIFGAYFLYAEWRFPAEKDGSWAAGMFVLGKWKEVDWKKFKHNLLCWLVKGYFLAIMFGDLASGVPKFRLADWNLFHLEFMTAFNLLFSAVVTFELVFVSAGYAFPARLFNSQVRTVEHTLLGWFIALMSYGPFLIIFYNNYLGYRGGESSWRNLFAGHETLTMIWGTTILVLIIIHMWCDACFGVRFSNLTNRGVITNGAYRFSKHPAYVLKYIRWAMVSLPFMTAPVWEENLRFTLLFLGVGLGYIVRAYTEERLLSSDPDYVAYALWMEKHGWLRWVGQVLPFMRYESRLKKWRERGELQPMIGAPVI